MRKAVELHGKSLSFNEQTGSLTDDEEVDVETSMHVDEQILDAQSDHEGSDEAGDMYTDTPE